MFLIEASIGMSAIHGVGVFAKQPIKKGTVVWVAHKGFDIYVTQEQIDALPPVTKQSVVDHVYYNNRNGRIVLSGDAAKYMNHSDNPNCDTLLWTSEEDMKSYGLGAEVDWTEGCNIAARDIEAGEELTCNYKDFDSDASRKLGEHA